MKLITINVSDDEHKFIKVKASQNGMSIKNYLLNTVIWDNMFDDGAKRLTSSAKSTVLEEPTSQMGPDVPAAIIKNLEFKPCKHNADPRMCKFAKPGKACK